MRSEMVLYEMTTIKSVWKYSNMGKKNYNEKSKFTEK